MSIIYFINYLHIMCDYKSRYQRQIEFEKSFTFQTSHKWNKIFENACAANNYEKVVLILKQKESIVNINVGLNIACYNNNLKLVKLLVNYGANDYNRGVANVCFNPLNNNKDCIKIIQLLLIKGANNLGLALLNACITNNVIAVKFLIENNINYSLINKLDLYNIFILASLNSNWKIINVLLKSKFSQNVLRFSIIKCLTDYNNYKNIQNIKLIIEKIHHKMYFLDEIFAIETIKHSYKLYFTTSKLIKFLTFPFSYDTDKDKLFKLLNCGFTVSKLEKLFIFPSGIDIFYKDCNKDGNKYYNILKKYLIKDLSVIIMDYIIF